MKGHTLILVSTLLTKVWQNSQCFKMDVVAEGATKNLIQGLSYLNRSNTVSLSFFATSCGSGANASWLWSGTPDDGLMAYLPAPGPQSSSACRLFSRCRQQNGDDGAHHPPANTCQYHWKCVLDSVLMACCARFPVVYWCWLNAARVGKKKHCTLLLNILISTMAPSLHITSSYMHLKVG